MQTIGTCRCQKSTTADDGKAAPSPRRRHVTACATICCCWRWPAPGALTYPLTKIGLQSIPPVTFIAARSLVAAAFLLAVMRLRGITLPTDLKAWKLFALQQVINSTFPFLIITWAQQYVPASNTVVLAATTPIFSFLITWGITRHEPAIAPETRRRDPGACRHRRHHRARCARQASATRSSPRSRS